MIAAVKVRGDIDARENTSRTLENLNLEKNNRCVVFEQSNSIEGMLNAAKDYIAYGEINDETLEKLEERKGEELESGDTVDLTAPSGGFKSTKKNYGQGGSLGKNPDMDRLIARMV